MPIKTETISESEKSVQLNVDYRTKNSFVVTSNQERTNGEEFKFFVHSIFYRVKLRQIHRDQLNLRANSDLYGFMCDEACRGHR